MATISDSSPQFANADQVWADPADLALPDAIGLRFTSPYGGIVTVWFDNAPEDLDGFHVGVSGSGIDDLTLGMTVLLMDGTWMGFVIEGEIVTC